VTECAETKPARHAFLARIEKALVQALDTNGRMIMINTHHDSSDGMAAQNRHAPKAHSARGPAAADVQGDGAGPAAAVQAELSEAARSVARAYHDQLQRLQADFDSYRQRSRQLEAGARADAERELLVDFIGILDGFEIGLGNARTQRVPSGFIEGFELVRDQIEDVLRRNGVERVTSVGRPLDPSVHECVGREPSGRYSEDVIIRELRAGYMRNDRLLRPAQVVVSAGQAVSAWDRQGTPVRVTIR